jgi:heme-degrading monooxygenase HmoA
MMSSALGRSAAMPRLTIDLQNSPDLHFRIDGFSVPDAARAEFEEAMHRNMAFIQTLPGFLGHVAFEKTGGPSTLNVVTIAVWQSQRAFEKASEEVRGHYRRIGFDGPAIMARWGVRAEVGDYHAPSRMQQENSSR